MAATAVAWHRYHDQSASTHCLYQLTICVNSQSVSTSQFESTHNRCQLTVCVNSQSTSTQSVCQLTVCINSQLLASTHSRCQQLTVCSLYQLTVCINSQLVSTTHSMYQITVGFKSLGCELQYGTSSYNFPAIHWCKLRHLFLQRNLNGKKVATS